MKNVLKIGLVVLLTIVQALIPNYVYAENKDEPLDEISYVNVQVLIDNLPSVDEFDSINIEKTKTDLGSIESIIDTLSEEEILSLDLTKYNNLVCYCSEKESATDSQNDNVNSPQEHNSDTIEIDFKLNYIEDNIDSERLQHNYSKRKLFKNESFPAKYSLVEEGKVTPIKFQNPYGSCWSFAAIASAESNYITKTGDTTIDLSELHLAWFAFNDYEIPDELGLITNDGGEYKYGGNKNELSIDVLDNPLDNGGNQEIATQALAEGIGLINETKLPYPTKDIFNVNYIKELPNNELCYKNDYRLTGVNWYNAKDKNEIKKALMEKGALATAFFFDESCFNNKYNSYYINNKYAQNHAVTIVGWDDDYSASNFNTTPAGDGAWLIKNSWSTYWGDHGYFWLSYYDSSMESVAFGYEIDKLNQSNDYNLYQYDGGYSTSLLQGQVITLANVFKAQTNSLIKEVGIYTNDADTEYTIDIYVGGNQDNPLSGTLKYKQKGKVTFAGYHTIKLDSPEQGYSTDVAVSKDECFSIVVTYSHENGEFVCVPLSSNLNGYGNVNFHDDVTNDHSYKITSSNSYSSIKNSCTARIKAYLQDNKEENEYPYTIKYYYQNIEDDDYSLIEDDTKTKYGKNGESISIAPDNVEGFTLNNGKSTLSTTISGSTTSPLEVYYDRNKYNLTFNIGEGASIVNKNLPQVKYGATIIKPENPTKDNYKFNGWDSDIPSTMPAKNLVFTAEWTTNEVKFDVVHYIQNNSIGGYAVYLNETKKGTEGSQLSISEYVLDNINGYKYNEELTAEKNKSPLVLDFGDKNHITISIYYDLQQYKLTLEKTEGIDLQTGDFYYNYQSEVTITAFLKDGYEFDEWQGDTANCTIKGNQLMLKMPSNDISLKACAKPIKYSITYNGLTDATINSNPNEYTIETETFIINNPTKDGYTFDGWLINEDTNTKDEVSINKGSIGNITLTAKWINNKVDVTTLGLNENDDVYVDGKAYKVNTNNSITIDNGRSSVLTVYEHNVSDTPDDIHTIYPTKINVYTLEKDNDGNLSLVHHENLDDILKYAGASIRVTGKKGIRIITSIPTTKKNSLINNGYDGYKVMEYGTIMAWSSSLEGKEPSLIKDDNGNFKAITGCAKGEAFSRKNNKNAIYKESNGISQYTNTLVESDGKEWTNEECGKDFAMRSYMVLRPASKTDSSNDIVIYGGTLYRSISYVALQNKNTFKPKTDAYEYIWKLIRAGYGNKYDADYKAE